ncbi:hypothetical protein ABIB25_004075 [Nakamurella sp. UYEF19]|uniref:hypothetical protein n=1 Tax=Nakamurella sp. UYEF19 TaxID=1756392 RepID=UPI003393BD3A
MNRSTLIAVVGAAALLLASCSSTSSTAATSSSTSSPAAVSSVASSPPASSAPVSSAPESSAPVSSATESSAPASSAPESSAPESSAPASSAPESSAPVSSGGTGSGSLDAPTTAWFSAFCGGLTPFFVDIKDIKAKQAGIGATDYAGQQKLLGGFLQAASTYLTDTGTTLKGLPAPTFTGGSEFATKTVAFFGEAGPAFAAAAKKLAATPATKDALTAAAAEFGTQLKGVSAQIAGVGSLGIPEATKGQLLQVPACVKLQSTVTG